MVESPKSTTAVEDAPPPVMHVMPAVIHTEVADNKPSDVLIFTADLTPDALVA